MKLIHLSDLHLGKRVNEFSMLEDQKDILNKIIAVIEEEQPDAVLIAGDVYDKSVPSAEAVELFDEFLVQLANTKTQVFIISGNHDSAERLAFANRLIDASGIHLAPVYRGEVAPFSFKDEYGTVDLYMLPFVKPANVRRFFPEEEIRSYEDALKPLYRLNYEQPENDSVSRVLAWALTCQGKLEQAAKYYEQLTGREQQNDEDLKNFGYCLWLQGEVGRAADLFRLYCQRNEQATAMLSDFFDTEWLQKRGITMVEINMMQALL